MKRPYRRLRVIVEIGGSPPAPTGKVYLTDGLERFYLDTSMMKPPQATKLARNLERVLVHHTKLVLQGNYMRRLKAARRDGVSRG